MPGSTNKSTLNKSLTCKHLGCSLAAFCGALLLGAGNVFAAPPAPTGLVGSISGDRIELSWDEDLSGEATGYNVYINSSYADTVLDNLYVADADITVLNSYTVVAFSSDPLEFSAASESIELPLSLIPTDLTIPPIQPQNLTGEIDDTRVTLSWDASTDDEAVQGYNIYRNESYLTTAFDTTYEDTVTAGESNSWYVVAFDIRQNFSARSEKLRLPVGEPVDTTLPPSVPEQLEGLTSTAASGTVNATLTWAASSDDQQVAGYNIYTDGVYTTTVFDTNYSTVLAQETFTTFTVVAFDYDDNFSFQSSPLVLPEISDTAALNEPPSQPQALQGSIDETTVELSWQASTDNIGIGGYNIYRNNSYLTTVFNNAYSGTVSADETYSYYVVAFDRQNNFSTPSAQLLLPENAAQPSAAAPSEPENLVGSLTLDETSGSYTVNLAWSPAEDDGGIAGYNVYRNNQYLTTVAGTSYEGNVDSAGPFSFHVVAFDIPRNFSDASERLSLPSNENQPPFFDGFESHSTDAGQLWELIIRPLDIDGGSPGLFGGPLPEGMNSVDNFDGTRTLSWRPLQPAVGDHDITFTAFDERDPSLTTTQTITLSVVLPEDLSTIPNPGPTIDAIGDYTIRAGDTLVMRVKAVDANGTIPDLQILNAPAGSSFDSHPIDARVRVLRWSTSASDIGTHRFDFVARDADDASLEFDSSVELNIVDGSFYTRPGQRLRDLASERGFLFGYAHLLEWYEQPDGDLYASIAAEEFNMMSTENSMKMGYIHPHPDTYRWEGADAEIAFAKDNNMLIHGHPLVWYTILPPWIIESEVSEREAIMTNFIDTVVSRYRDDVAIWDVVNEAIEADGSYRDSVWFQAMGEDYINLAFERARANTPDATLLYNDYDVAFNGPKSDAMYALMQKLLSEGVPVDGVGFQMHLTSSFDRFDEVAANFQRFADLGLEIYITELDVAMEAGDSDQQQAEVFADAVSICLAQSACKAAQIWGYTDRYSWLRDRNALILDREYQAKAAYGALQNVLSQ